MILYKYYGYAAGIAALESSRLGFSTPSSFNDPYELSSLDNAEGPDSKLTALDQCLKNLRESVAILSLTRTPINPLMWAHYGKEHSGFVIGYRVDTPFLMSPAHNIIPVDRGDVVYTSTKAPHALTIERMAQLTSIYRESVMGRSSGDAADNEVLSRQLYLIKHSCWVYEEEVRVVKRILHLDLDSSEESHPFNEYNSISRDVAPGHAIDSVEGLNLFSQKVQIEEVYLGLRNPLLRPLEPNDSQQGPTPEVWSLREAAASENWRVFSMTMGRGSWNMGKLTVSLDELRYQPPQSSLTAEVTLTGKQMLYLRDRIDAGEVHPDDSYLFTEMNGHFNIRKNGSWI